MAVRRKRLSIKAPYITTKDLAYYIQSSQFVMEYIPDYNICFAVHKPINTRLIFNKTNYEDLHVYYLIVDTRMFYYPQSNKSLSGNLRI